MILCTGDEPCTGTCRSLAALGSADHPRPAAHHRPQARRQSASCACRLAPNDDKHICVTVNQRVRSGQQHRAPTHRDVTNSGQWPVGSGRVGSAPLRCRRVTTYLDAFILDHFQMRGLVMMPVLGGGGSSSHGVFRWPHSAPPGSSSLSRWLSLRDPLAVSWFVQSGQLKYLTAKLILETTVTNRQVRGTVKVTNEDEDVNTLDLFVCFGWSVALWRTILSSEMMDLKMRNDGITCQVRGSS